MPPSAAWAGLGCDGPFAPVASRRSVSMASTGQENVELFAPVRHPAPGTPRAIGGRAVRDGPDRDTVATSKWSHARGNMQIREKMQIDAILCNHAEAVNNLLYISGGGISANLVPPGTNPPYLVNLGIGIMVTVPWNLANQQHEVEIQLVTEDGRPVLVPSAPDSTQPVHVRLAFNLGRPPTITIGDDQQVCLAANMPGLPFAALGKYEFIVRIDENDERRLPFRVQPMVGMQIVPGPGASGSIGQRPN
jgi:hypothetical protein